MVVLRRSKVVSSGPFALQTYLGGARLLAGSQHRYAPSTKKPRQPTFGVRTGTRPPLHVAASLSTEGAQQSLPGLVQ